MTTPIAKPPIAVMIEELTRLAAVYMFYEPSSILALLPHVNQISEKRYSADRYLIEVIAFAIMLIVTALQRSEGALVNLANDVIETANMIVTVLKYTRGALQTPSVDDQIRLAKYFLLFG